MATYTSYNPHEHIKIWYAKSNGTQQQVQHYPLGWRLYELAMNCPEANFETEIMHLDPEADFVVIRARLYIGSDYATAQKKTTAFSQGRLMHLYKVESAAKSRAARDWGYSTEHALAMVPRSPEIDPEIRQALNDCLDRTKALNLIEKPYRDNLLSLIGETVDKLIEDPMDLSIEDLKAFQSFLDSKEAQ